MTDDLKKPVTEDSTSEHDERKYTQSELDRLISQSRKEWEKKAKLAQMDEVQRIQAELEEQRSENEELKRRMVISNNLKEVTPILSELSILELADFIVSEDKDKTTKNIKRFEKVINAAIEKRMKEHPISPTPKAGSDISIGMTQEQFDNLTLEGMAELRVKNPDLYNQFAAIKV